MSEIIDFSTRFTADYIAWCQKHPEIAANEDKLEELFPVQYEKWYATPKKWLNGKTPVQYFEEIGDEKIYASLFVSYVEEGIEVPEPLIECMLSCRKKIYPILRNILFVEGGGDIEKDALCDVRAKIISLIDEMQMEHPYGRYISLLLEAEEADELLTEALCIALEESGCPEEIRRSLLEVYPFSDGVGRICILGLLCGFPDDGTVYSLLIEEFKRQELELAYIAELAGKLGDERLLPCLEKAINEEGLDYITHTALQYAIERITGEELETKDFSGDPVFDYLAGMGEKGEE